MPYATREQVVAEARAWIGSKYHLGQCVRGVAADCATLILGVYKNCGFVSDTDHSVYAHDWWIHAREDKYELRVVRHAYKLVEGVCHRTLDAAPGNIIMTRVAGSRIYNHGAIVTKWPFVVHARRPEVVETNVSRDPMWSHQLVVVYDPWLKLRTEGIETTE
jgi:cell wall-associated NlpC family hydrolase